MRRTSSIANKNAVLFIVAVMALELYRKIHTKMQILAIGSRQIALDLKNFSLLKSVLIWTFQISVVFRRHSKGKGDFSRVIARSNEKPADLRSNVSSKPIFELFPEFLLR